MAPRVGVGRARVSGQAYMIRGAGKKLRPSFRYAGVSRVSPTALLMVVASHDTVALTDLALAAYEQALEPKKLVFRVISEGYET